MVVGIFFGWGFEILALPYLRLMLLSKIDVPQYLFPSLTWIQLGPGTRSTPPHSKSPGGLG